MFGKHLYRPILVLAVIVHYSALPWGLGIQPVHAQWIIVLNGNQIQPLIYLMHLIVFIE